MPELNETHDPKRRSHVDSANAIDTDFPIQNLPFGMFAHRGAAPRPGVAIGDRILDLGAVLEGGHLEGLAADAARAAGQGTGLNDLMALGNEAASALRARLSNLLDAAQGHADALAGALVPMAEAEMHMPVNVGNFTDFLTSTDHFNRFRPKAVLPANFMSLPLAYHSRASSVRLGGDVVRPHVQSADENDKVTFAPTTKMDYELELGFYVAEGNILGDPVRIAQAHSRIFGYCLLNDWSVRDAQWFESAPLGPFLSKSVSTTISPWVVTEEALRPFRAAARARGSGELAPLPHLTDERDQAAGALDIELQALIRTDRLRTADEDGCVVTRTNARHLYWTFAQMLTHHASNGCNLQPGDVLGSGTISGPEPESRACLAEINAKGTESFALTSGETRTWLEDGDEVVFRGKARRNGYVPIGFGEARGRIVPAVVW